MMSLESEVSGASLSASPTTKSEARHSRCLQTGVFCRFSSTPQLCLMLVDSYRSRSSPVSCPPRPGTPDPRGGHAGGRKADVSLRTRPPSTAAAALRTLLPVRSSRRQSFPWTRRRATAWRRSPARAFGHNKPALQLGGGLPGVSYGAYFLVRGPWGAASLFLVAGCSGRILWRLFCLAGGG